MAQSTIQLKIMREVLADGLWHLYEDAIYEIARRIPPNLAVHRGELQRKRNYKKDHPDSPKVPDRKLHTSFEEQVMFGARLVARIVLMNNPSVEHAKTTDGKRYVRMRKAMVEPPECDIGEWERVLTRPDRGVPFCQLPVDEQKKLRAERYERSRRTRLIRRGINPDTFVSDWPSRAAAQQRYQQMTPEEKVAYHSAASKKGHETRKRKAAEKEQNANEVSPGD